MFMQPHESKHAIVMIIPLVASEISSKMHPFWSISRGGHFTTCRRPKVVLRAFRAQLQKTVW